jgi:hypothetical protein
MTCERSSCLSGWHYLFAQKTPPGPFLLQIVYRQESPLTLKVVNALHHVLAQQPCNQGQGTHEYEPKRGNMLEFNHFRMVNVIELVSKSQKSHKSQ